jgi:hypothetical protein
MSLVGVATRGCCLCAFRWDTEILEHPKRSLESCNARQTFGRDPHERVEAALQMAARQLRAVRDLIDREVAVRADDEFYRVSHATIEPRRVEVSRDDGLHHHEGLVQRCSGITQYAERVEQTRREYINTEGASHQIVCRHVDQRWRCVRPKSHPHHRNLPSWSQEQLIRQLAGEQDVRLPLDATRQPNPLECIAKMNDELGMAIWQDRLEFVFEFGRVPPQRPDAFDEMSERRRRSVLGVVHARAGYRRGRICSSEHANGPTTITQTSRFPHLLRTP